MKYNEHVSRANSAHWAEDLREEAEIEYGREEALQEWQAARQAREAAAEQEDCPHDEHDHGVCLDCGKDIWDDVVAAAEFRADCMEDR